MREYGELLLAGNQAQIQKLIENKDKGHWSELGLNELFILLSDEVDELEDELQIENQYDFEAIKKEAADIANFAHFIISKCNKELEK